MFKNIQAPAFIRFSLLVSALFILAACDWVTDEPDTSAPVVSAAPSFLRMAPGEPPPPVPEEKPPLDNPRNVAWRPGYWSYDDNQYTWIPGSYITKPTFTAVWSPDHYEKREYGWVFVPGYWQ